MKDYSKLRPFDLAAAKPGDDFLFIAGREAKPRKLIAGPDKSGWIVFENEQGVYSFGLPAYCRLSPLAWVRKSADDDTLWPVYKGDVLWHSCVGKCEALRLSTLEDHDLLIRADGLREAKLEFLTFTPPKMKREGWINIYSQKSGGGIIYASKREAEEAVVTSGAVQLHIEW